MSVVLKNGFIINPPQHLKTSYRIGPFKTSDNTQNSENFHSNNHCIDDFFAQKHPNKELLITDNGRSAINACLAILSLKADDVVTILTTTDNFYISGCVTAEIERYCQWSRKIEPNTKALFVNHEFGFCRQDMAELKSLGLPIIEDFAHSFLSDTEQQDAGMNADFIIYSFSKVFPIQVGGALLYDKKWHNKSLYASNMKDYILNIANHYLHDLKRIKEVRLDNYDYFEKVFSKKGFYPYFEKNTHDCPAVYCFQTPDAINLNKLKVFFNNNGIESSIFYGQNAYFLPCHQNITSRDVDYFFELICYFMENGDDIK